jgi:transcriptional antiterminator NusG
MLNPTTEFCGHFVNICIPPSWYAIRTRPNHEKTTAYLLVNKGYETYFPTYKSKLHPTKRAAIAERALFPGYVFCRFNVKTRMPIITSPGVVSILGFGNEPAPIPEDEIEAIKTLLRSGFDAEPLQFLTEGQRVRIECGPLEGLEGILLKKRNRYRLIISVTMLQRSISVEIDRDSISPFLDVTF